MLHEIIEKQTIKAVAELTIMRLKNSKSNQNNQANQSLNDYSMKLYNWLLKRFFWCCNSTLSAAIALSVSSVQTEARLPVVQNCESVDPGLKTSFNSVPPAPKLSISVSKAIALYKEQPHTSTQDSLSSVALTKDIHSTRSLNQVANLLPEPSPAYTESLSPLSPIVHANTPTLQPNEVFSKPTSSERWQFSAEPYFFVPLNLSERQWAFEEMCLVLISMPIETLAGIY